MKILILSLYYYPDLCAGSFRTTALVNQLKELVNSDIEIEVITTHPNRYASYCVNSLEYEKDGILTIRRLKLPNHKNDLISQTQSYITFVKEVKKITHSKEYSLVFATSSRLMTAVLGSWVAKKSSAKLYLDIRDLFLDTLGDVFPNKFTFWSKPVFSLLEKWSFNQADCINLVSKGFESYFEKRYPNKHLSWFTNGIDKEFILPIPSAENLQQAPKPIKVLYAGNIGEGQGLHLIIPLLAKQMQSSVHFKVIGDGGRKALLEIELEKWNCSNVEIVAPISREELINEYQKADVLFLHLNDHNAFKKVLPSKIFEYAATGKPIWAGLCGYSARFVTSEITNAVVFSPCDSMDAVLKFNKLSLCVQDRIDFKDKYSRKKIMHDMANDILSLITNVKS